MLEQITTDDYLRVKSDPSGNTFGIGDCADIDKYPLPCTAQVSFLFSSFFCFLQQWLLVLLHFCLKEVPPNMPSGNTTFLCIFFSHKQASGD